MTSKPNFYQVLHLHPDAPAPMVRTAYRTIMQKLKAHPDLGGDAAHAALINEAYETLSDTNKRARYDRLLAEDLVSQRGEFKRRAEDRERPDTSAKSSRTRNSKTSGNQHFDSSDGPAHTSEQEHRRSNAQKNGNSADSFSTQKKQYSKLNRDQCLFCFSMQRGFPKHNNNCETCGSPLGHASELAAIDADQENRRGILRLPRSGPVSIFLQREFIDLQSPQDFHNRCTHYTHFATAKDLSPSGMRIASMEVLRLDDILRIENQSLIAVASIANHMPTPQQPSSNTYGLQFLAVSLKKAQGGFVSTAV